MSDLTDSFNEVEESEKAVEASAVAVFEDSPSAPKEKPVKKPTSNNILFKRGDAGAHVKKMQECLNLLGFDCPETGRLCATTESALKEAQKQSGLEVTGKLDEATCAAICK